jgi:DNA-binding SARP family transcriptional activator
LKSAVALWRGHYLLGVDATWVWPERQRLEKMCVEAYRNLINLYLKIGEKNEVLAACQNALKIDPCLEDIHRTLMQIHAESGDRLAVIWQYQECQNALKNELEVTPSQETQALYKQLTH